MIDVNKQTGEMFLYGVVGDSFYEESFSAAELRQALAKLDGKRAIVRINSPGGVADEGIAIYNELTRYSGGVDTVVDALAASAASVIALAGATRTTSPGARWMIHKALTVEIGNSDQLRKTAELLDTYDRSLVEIYSKYIKKDASAIMQMMRDETWFTASDAITAGLATMSGEPSSALPMNADWFNHPPAELVASSTGIVQRAKIKSKALKVSNLRTRFDTNSGRA